MSEFRLSAVSRELMELDNFFFICIDGWDCYASIHTIYKTVMALDLCQNLISAQNLKNILMKFDQIFHMR